LSEKLDANDVAREQGSEGLARELDQRTQEAPLIPEGAAAADAPEEEAKALTPTYRSASKLISEYPTLRQPVVSSLLRIGETMNIIAPAKVGKSWLALDLALAVAVGLSWLGSFMTTQGNVLILDNELHDETIASRLPLVAKARGITIPPYSEAEEADGKGIGQARPGCRGYTTYAPSRRPSMT